MIFFFFISSSLLFSFLRFSLLSSLPLLLSCLSSYMSLFLFLFFFFSFLSLSSFYVFFLCLLSPCVGGVCVVVCVVVCVCVCGVVWWCVPCGVAR